MNILLFEDEQVTNLYPVSISRPPYTITCGSYRLIDLLAELDCPLRWLVRPHLRDTQAADFAALSQRPRQADQPWLIINAALVPSTTALGHLRRLLASATPGIVRGADGRIRAAVVPHDSAALQASTPNELIEAIRQAPLEPLDAMLEVFDYPHDVIRQHLLIVRESLEHRIGSGAYRQTADGVFLAPGAAVGPHVVTDSRQGPIVIDQGATIGAYTYLRGPVYIGRHARVIEHASIKDGACLGHTTKTGGEIEATIIEPFTNKQHHGFLGHSYLGSWINLGAGTCNSDLKNTYGQVNMEYHGRKIATGMQFVGTIVGDYAKTAINTGIFTGKTIGACSMVYGFVTTNVPSFVNYARLFGQVTETPVEVMIATQGRMFARRNVVQRPQDIQLLCDMYELTRHERQIGGDPLSL
jgi:glucose-1-phosphate thymidylyltransferase